MQVWNGMKLTDRSLYHIAYFCSLSLSLCRYKEGGEALLVLLPSEENGMIAQLQEKKVPINKIQ